LLLGRLACLSVSVVVEQCPEGWGPEGVGEHGALVPVPPPRRAAMSMSLRKASAERCRPSGLCTVCNLKGSELAFSQCREVFRPYGCSISFLVTLSHGLRRGLHSFAASRLMLLAWLC
jgi:hypothetical protein